MSGGVLSMALTESDVTKFITATSHLGSTNMNFQMDPYIHKRRPDGVHVINLKKTYEKMLLAARAVAAIENPADVYVISSRPMGQRAVLKFARHTGATPIAGRFTPGAFTNQIQAAFREPRLLVVTDPVADHQPVTEASYVNIPVIAFCNTDSNLTYVDIAIPCNNKSPQSVGLMWWMLSREVLRLRGTISRAIPWEDDVMPDLFFYRDPEEQEKEETARAEAAKESETTKDQPAVMEVEKWSTGLDAEEPQIVPNAATQVAPKIDEWGSAPDEWAATQAPTTTAAAAASDDWGASTDTGNWN